MVSTVESGIRQGTFFPDLKGERFERALMQQIGGDYEELIYQNLRKLTYLSSEQTINLNPYSEGGRNSRAINLYRGFLQQDAASIDFFPPWTEIERSEQIAEHRDSSGRLTNRHDFPSLYHLFWGRFGVYLPRDYNNEEILHDNPDCPWAFTIVSGARSHKLVIWERSALVLTTFPGAIALPPPF